MARFNAPNTVLLIAVFFAVINGNESRNFPLDGCSTDLMDVLMLYSDIYNDNYKLWDLQKFQRVSFFKHLLSFPSNESTPRIMFADVYDRFSDSHPLVNVSSWKFLTSPREESYGFIEERQLKYMEYMNVQEMVEKKVAFTRRLFSEMGGVRENVTQVAVLFLDLAPFSYEESRSVPYFIELQDTDIKVFTVAVLSGDIKIEAVHLNETLIVTLKNIPARALVMAMCNQCVSGSFPFRHYVSTDYLSCYQILEFSEKKSWELAYGDCSRGSHGDLVMTETYEEFEFLRGKLVSSFKNIGNYAHAINGSFVIPIGLRRPHSKKGTRIKWFKPGQDQYFRPLVVNKWLPGNPSLGHDCAVWQFSWRRSADMDAVNVSGSNEEFIDGWVDVGCEDEIAFFGLCENTLPRKVEEIPLIKIKPANEESVRRVLKKQDFMKFGENLIAITVNTENSEFRKFLGDTNRDFPVFACSPDAYNLQYIPYSYLCDKVNHCKNRADESYCKTKIIGLRPPECMHKICYGVQCCDGACLPLQLVNDGEVDCWICDNFNGNFTDERAGLNKYLRRNETCAFICNNDQCVHFSQLNDGHTDCTGPEGPLDETVGKLKTADTCYNMLGYKIWAPMCVYVKIRFDLLLGCRDLSHLKNCTDFECPEGYVKCVNTYCIPQHYVLDGIFDCPTGEDEQADIIGPCIGNVACWNSKICLHPDLVCDGHPDCPHGDDEGNCDDRCDEGFRSVAGTITVSDYNRSIPLRSAPFQKGNATYVDFSGLDLSQMESILSYVPNTTLCFKCSSCNIANYGHLCFANFVTIHEVDISYNQILKVDAKKTTCPPFIFLRILNMSYNRELFEVRLWSKFSILEIVDFSHTALASLDNSTLGELQFLTHLDLSFTPITRFHENSLKRKMIMHMLDLRGLLLDGFHEDFFYGLAVSLDLYTDSYQLCCPQVRGANIPAHTCHAPDDAISSCFDLIAVDVQRVLLWVVAVLAVLGNITVIVYRVIWDRSVLITGYGLFVTSLNVSDFIMGIYLFIIAGADYYYRGVYVLHDESWRESVACTLAGFLATLSCETSMFIIFFISLDRFLVMKFLFGQKKLSQKGNIIALALSWVFGFLFALTPIVFRFDLYSSNAVCFGLPLTTKRIIGWEFSFFVFIALNMSLCLVIAYVQRAIFQAMSENRITGTESSTSPRRIGDILVAKQLSLVALSCFLCWFPIGVMGLLSLSGHEIGNDVFAWITVIVLPINSAANPILYTIPALIAKWEKFKQGGKRSRRRSV